MKLSYDEVKRRCDAVRSVYFAYPAIDAALEAIADLHHLGFIGPENEGQCAFIEGETGSGKSRLFEEYAKACPAVSNGTKRMPVVIATTPPSFTLNGFAVELVKAMDAEGANSVGDKLERLTDRLRRLLDKGRVELLMIEEFQHLVDRSKNAVVVPYKTADWLKVILKTGVRIVFNGTSAAEAIFADNAQLMRRRRWRLELKPFDWRNAHQRRQFCTLLEGFELEFDFPKPSNLQDPDTAERMYRACNGYLGQLVKFLIPAGEAAMKRGGDRILMADLARAYAMNVAPAPRSFNPFTVPKLPSREALDEASGDVRSAARAAA